ncbi:MAG TPA: diguanylate cyclase [Tepidisphaeraceae bacterium]|jgi:diguanylate cyclase (GGDEF)-like protein
MPQRLLIIDDAPQMQRLIDVWLKGDNLDVRYAQNASEGLAAATECQPHLILLDVDMPDMNGFELCRRIKSDSSLTGTPIIFLTGAGSPEERVRGLNLGAVDYIVKPFHPGEFQARVRAALRTKSLLDLLRERAKIDGLTALGNRAHFDERFAAELSIHHRRLSPISCVMLDVDHFKEVNDRWGHLAGDDVLRHIAQLLLNGTRAEDVVARYGGEEFVILAPGVDVSGAHVLAERLRHIIENSTVQRHNGSVRVTCSFGVAQVMPTLEANLVECADAALYAAKTSGRNRVMAFQPDMLPLRIHAAA